MLIIILIIVIALVAWSLHLMQEAIEQREFSLMLAGTLVAFSAAALVGVYFLMGNYVGYMARTSHTPSTYSAQSYETILWYAETEKLDDAQALYQ
jgi:Kef-type K+ transport system membrane component KefB